MFGQSVPLDTVLRMYLEIPNALNDIMSYVDSLKTDPGVKENFVQYKLWEKKCEKFSKDDIVLPLNIYYDECQCNNPLGSCAKKLGCVYCQIACLPPECQSVVQSIFLALVFEASLRSFSDNRAFAPLISILNKLEKDGIVVNNRDGPKKVYFVCGLLLGDNLGLNSLGGLTECFTACFYCRFCKLHKNVCAVQSVEDETSLRTKDNYNADLTTENVTLTGVKMDCCLHEVPSFHITSNYCVDVFHDLCEDVCHYVMMHVLRHCIPQFFLLDLLNHRIEMLQYGLCDSNRIPVLSDEFAKRDKLKMSGSETLLFVRLFGVLVGDKVPHDDDFWLLYVKLRELLDICLCKSLSIRQGAYIRVLEEFNSLYIKITNDSLKPKMHFFGSLM
ncbi:hypothetical protein ONE63_006715 [Megalurothrips usitatus]|uniref:Uncharacterized protein n=1 Tax=Megalurothrips usitatus TaxID=439358 RepID=A0AAV7XU94_9NEOP|nr:hypothetical protein ONE63_006715 [Megalurothrips usitatus]